MANLMFTIPHSGEQVPECATWLQNLDEKILMCDVDRYVDRLYMPTLQKLQIPSVTTKWHRYAADLNRIPADVDQSSVMGSNNPAGMHNRGFHWVVTTQNQSLMSQPMSKETHQQLVDLIYSPFHQEIQSLVSKLKQKDEVIFHVDAHSMPSLGTKMHRDPGQFRADIVVSDCMGKSCSNRFKDLVIAAYATAGFKVAYNWPYFGGRLTEQYGVPAKAHHGIQVELNRSLYMDEVSKHLDLEKAQQVTKKIESAVNYIVQNLDTCLPS